MTIYFILKLKLIRFETLSYFIPVRHPHVGVSDTANLICLRSECRVSTTDSRDIVRIPGSRARLRVC
uniref:Uncharacterized protein n=1 Tax=Spodoptera littoralis nuclear polyhedrosis virus TaxID=10456 RepID=A0A3G4S912_NPVSL|nr:hypothetical protein [Spodoptera littoralis nucleopolyhedrovirus]